MKINKKIAAMTALVGSYAVLASLTLATSNATPAFADEVVVVTQAKHHGRHHREALAMTLSGQTEYSGITEESGQRGLLDKTLGKVLPVTPYNFDVQQEYIFDRGY